LRDVDIVLSRTRFHLPNSLIIYERRSCSNSVLGFTGWLVSFLVLVKLHELGKIVLGLLKDLGLSDDAVVLKWEDLAALLLDLFSNFLFNAKKQAKILINNFKNWKRELTES